ncbi:carboxypeptidase regulatory-like domain-containing protein, partial [bacterium]|nr:carboxypeptidase regulatory-like domain-containing protein [bacterium]
TFPCRIVYGTLAGQVTEQGSGTPVAGVALGGWISGADTTATPAAFHVATDGSGNYAVPDSLVVGRYDIYASKFGYIGQLETPMVVYGPNTYNFAITAAPSGDVSGAVTQAGTGIPLAATVNVYRTDDGSLYATAATDSAAGGTYSVTGLPYFNYRFEVRAYHHRKAVRTVTVEGATRTEDFALETTQGDILVIDDHDAKGAERGKMIGKDEQGNPVVVANGEPSREAKLGESAVMFAGLLGELGYSVTSETAAGTNPATWSGYDAVVWSCGPDQGPLSVAAYRTNLISYVNAGGKLLLEGGEIAYDWDTEDATFASTVMHANDWDTDDAGALTLQQAGHALATTPNALPASLAIAYGSDYGNQDASKPANNGTVVYGTTDYAADGGIIAYDNDGDPVNGQVVFYLFNVQVLADSATRAQVLENSIEYLLRQGTPPASTLSGVARLSGQTDHSGIVVSARLGGTTYFDTTDATGSYGMTVFDGTYQ